MNSTKVTNMARNVNLDAGENIRDLILKNKKYEKQSKFERVKAELQGAFAAPERDYMPLTSDDIFMRNDHFRRL